ncbi:uroplakin-3b-like protein 1 [Amia ocellicauda]|uniref:uroplakin-3b-like protein 1 n=1 Tax=Amia ocellicauda TaxID=2972642 RepID=UPI0034648217
MWCVAVTWLLCVRLCGSAVVPYSPEVSPLNIAGRITSTTMVLRQPLCYFENLASLPCSVDQCEIWLVVARNNGLQNFDNIKGNRNIVSQSPYPRAFESASSPNYFLTKLGVQASFPCAELLGLRYFQVGAEGNCTSSNCNGFLPFASTVSVKFILVSPVFSVMVSETPWSQSITLIAPKPSSSLDDRMGRRSAGMIVITTIASCLLAVLLLLLLSVLLLRCCAFSQGKHKITSPPCRGSLRRYRTHNLNNPDYSNLHI